MPTVKKVRTLVNCFSQSNIMQSELHKHQELCGLPMTKPIKPNQTRWNSFGETVGWLLTNMPALEAFDTDPASKDVVTRAVFPGDSVYGDGALMLDDWARLQQLVCTTTCSRVPTLCSMRTPNVQRSV